MTGSSGHRCLISCSRDSRSISGMLMSDKITISCGSMPLELLQSLRSRVRKVQHVLSLVHFMAKMLAKERGNIGLIVDHQDTHAHAALATSVGRSMRGRRTVNSVNAPGSLSTVI